MRQGRSPPPRHAGTPLLKDDLYRLENGNDSDEYPDDGSYARGRDFVLSRLPWLSCLGKCGIFGFAGFMMFLFAWQFRLALQFFYSDCEAPLATFLYVNSIGGYGFTALLVGASCFKTCGNDRLAECMDRGCVAGWLRCLLLCAAIVWHAIGSSWVFGMSVTGNECPPELYYFTFWYMVAFWAFAGACSLVLLILVVSVCCSWLGTDR